MTDLAGESSWSCAGHPCGVDAVLVAGEDAVLGEYGMNVGWSSLSGVSVVGESRVPISVIAECSSWLLSPVGEKILPYGQAVWLTTPELILASLWRSSMSFITLHAT